MHEYETIAEVSQTPATTPKSQVMRWNGTTYVIPAYTYTAPVPSPKTRYYEPEEKHAFRNASTDGSWRYIRANPFAIKMTEMEAFRGSVNRHVAGIQRYMRQSHYHFASSPSTKYNTCGNPSNIDYQYSVATSGWMERGDLQYWGEQYPDLPFFKIERHFDDAEIEAKKSAAYQELYQQYNLGEELFELRDTIATIVSLLSRLGKTLLNDKDGLMKSFKDHRSAADAWLEYRYGIMPIIYSIQDVVKLYESKGHIHTVRKSVRPIPTSAVQPSDNCFYQTGVDGSSVNITVKGAWASSLDRILDQININPFTTAAAVYPWSLVVRWFFNVNSALDSWIKSYTSNIVAYNGCVAHKISRTIDTRLRLYEPRNYPDIYYNGHSEGCGSNFYPKLGPIAVNSTYDAGDILLMSEEVQWYKRVLFSPTDVKLVWNPSLSQQRIIDGLSFIIGSLKPISKGISR